LSEATAAHTVAAMRRERDPITDLRRAIDALPVSTREAMLDGIHANPIVVGAYTDDHGGICPMLAAHRHGGRTTLLAFARSWDRFAGSRRVRRATRRELTVLERQLTESLATAVDQDLRAAIAEHAELRARREAAPAAPEDDRVYPEIAAGRLKPGRLSRLRPLRNAADAERALANLDQLELATRA
jgi:hypothetical protein